MKKQKRSPKRVSSVVFPDKGKVALVIPIPSTLDHEAQENKSNEANKFLQFNILPPAWKQWKTGTKQSLER